MVTEWRNPRRTDGTAFSQTVRRSLAASRDPVNRRFAASGYGRTVAGAATAASRSSGNNPRGLIQGVQSAAVAVLGNNFVSGVLNALDSPRRLVTSTLQETADLGQGDGFSMSDWAVQTLSPEAGIGVGDKVDTGNIWLDRALGFAGDVALDPLTYVTLGTGTVAKQGAGGLARAALEGGGVARAAGNRAAADSLDALATKIIRRGYRRVDDAEWSLLREHTGLDVAGGARLNLGRGRVGRGVVRAVSGGRKSSVSVRIGGEFVSNAIGRGVFAPLEGFHRLRSGALARKILGGNFASGDRRAARALLQTAEPAQVRDAFWTLDSANIGRGTAKAFGHETESAWSALAHTLQRKGVDGSTVTRALDGNEDAIRTLGDDYATVKSFVDGIPEMANSVSKRDFLGFRENWFPKLTDDSYVDFLRAEAADGAGRQARRKREGFTKASFEQSPNIVEGRNFMGVPLVAPSQAGGLGIVEQAWEIYVKRSAEIGGPENAARFFNEDIFQSMPAYLSGLAVRVGEQRTIAELAGRGIAESVWQASGRPMGDPRTVAALLRSADEVRKMRRAAHNAEEANAAATEATERAVADAAETTRLASEAAELAANPGRGGATTDVAKRAAGGEVATGPPAQTARNRLSAEDQAFQDVAAASARWEADLGTIVENVNNGSHSRALVQIRAQVGRPMYQRAAGMRELQNLESLAAEALELAGRQAQRQIGKRQVRGALGIDGTAVHRLEAQIAEVEQEIRGIRDIMLKGKWSPDALQREIDLRRTAKRRIQEYNDTADELDRVKANLLADPSNRGPQLQHQAQLNNRLSELKGAIVTQGSELHTPSGRVSREGLVEATRMLSEEMTLFQGYLNGTARFGFPGFDDFDNTQVLLAKELYAPLSDRRFGLEQLHTSMADTWAKMTADDTESAMRWMREFNMPFVDGSGKLRLRGPDGGETDVWFMSSMAEVPDLMSEFGQRGGRGAADELIGVRVSHNPREAALVPGGQERLTAVAVEASNPRVYASDSILEASGLRPFDKTVNSRTAYGSGRGAALTQIQNDMFMDAFVESIPVRGDGFNMAARAGAVSPAKLAGAARRYSTGVSSQAYGQTNRWKRLWEGLERVDDDPENVASVFEDVFGDVFRHHQGRRLNGVSRAEWTMNRVIDDAFGPKGFAAAKHKAEAAGAYVRRLKASGFDSLIYTGRDGNWNTMVFDQRQLPSAHYSEIDDMMDKLALEAGPNRLQLSGNATLKQLVESVDAARVGIADRVALSAQLAVRQIEPDWGRLAAEVVPGVDNRRVIRDWVTEQRGHAQLDLARTADRGGAIEVSGREVGRLDELLAAEKYLDDADRLRSAGASRMEDWRQGLLDESARMEAQVDLAQARVAEMEALAISTATGMADAHKALGKTVKKWDTKVGKFNAHIASSEAAWEAAGRKLATPRGREALSGALNGYSKIDDDMFVPDWVAETLRDQYQMAKPNNEALSGMLQAFDSATQAFKGWAVFSPGFHSRNLFGGMFNNMLAGVDPGTYRVFHKAFREYQNASRGVSGLRRVARREARPASHDEALGRAMATFDNESDRQAFMWLVEDGHMSGSGQTSEILQRNRGEGSKNPFSAKFAPIQSSRRIGEGVEIFLRGSLAFDRIRAGQAAARTADSPIDLMRAARSNAIADVFKYHFDYEDLSTLERTVFRRVVPFYTWTRRNFPLQLEMMLTKPRAYNRFTHLKRNMELGEDDSDFLPNYVQEQLHIRLPFGSDEEPIFWVPDLPFRELTRAISPVDIAASTNPIIRAPVEVARNKKFFTGGEVDWGSQRLPSYLGGALSEIPGMNQALIKFGLATDDPESDEVLIPSTWQYMLESNLPALNRAKTLLPSADDDYRRERMNDAWLNFVTGFGINTITESERQEDE